MLCLILPAQLVQVDVVPQLQITGGMFLQIVQPQILVAADASHHLIFVQLAQQFDCHRSITHMRIPEDYVQDNSLPHR